MEFKLIFTDSYNKKALKFFRRHKKLLRQYEKILRLLEINPFHSSLRLHGIKTNNKHNVYLVSINIGYRIILELIIKEREIIFINVGSHDEVY